MRKRQLLALLFAALTVGARLPFLISGKIPFDSDEAVEGLMARHVLNGELPAFFWGQAFKGVPEVYLSAGAFALLGSSVAVLKAVTLALFAAYVGANFVLLDKIASRWVAAAASSLLIAAPPALIFWSLDASAEYVVIMLLGTTLLLLTSAGWAPTGVSRAEGKEQRAQRSRLLAIGLVTGLGLWVHQLFVVYLIPLGIVLALRSEWWERRRPATLNRFVLGLGAIARHLFRPRHRRVSDRRLRVADRIGHDQRNGAAEDGAHRGRNPRPRCHRPIGHDGERTSAARHGAPVLDRRQPDFSSAIRPSCSIQRWWNRLDRRRGSRLCST